MTFKKTFYHGISAGILSALICSIYDQVYFFATESNFSKVINIPVLIGINLCACLIIAIAYWGFKKTGNRNVDIIFNLALSILSFASVVVPISISLPLTVEYPELFPGLAVPMHFFPAMAWFTLKPLFSFE